MPKEPWFQMYAGDWLSDTQLSACTSATRGIWMDLLCRMHLAGRVGQLRGTIEQLARLARCLPADMASALTELQTTEAADVMCRNEVWTVINRRMSKEHETREKDRARKHLERQGKLCPENVRDMSESCPPKKSEVRSQKSERGILNSPQKTGQTKAKPPPPFSVSEICWPDAIEHAQNIAREMPVRTKEEALAVLRLGVLVDQLIDWSIVRDSMNAVRAKAPTEHMSYLMATVKSQMAERGLDVVLASIVVPRKHVTKIELNPNGVVKRI